ncbi:MAG: hexitol phosphatase HxpB [Bacteroidetes bacterium]|nr:MAG: hexitol phosphatase HxpB [Bacteroidota bacterium]
MSISAIIFDMDGVLIDSEHHWQQTERSLFGELGIELTDELLVQTRGLRTEEMVAHWNSRFDLAHVSPEELKRRYDERMVETMRTEVLLMDGAEDAILFFRQKGLPVALATCSTRTHIEAALERHGLLNHFDLMVSAAEGMQGKPHPEVYLITASRLGIDPSRCLAIEDSFFGVIAAKAARMKVVAMPDPSEFDQPRFGAADLKIRSLREINEESYRFLQRL